MAAIEDVDQLIEQGYDVYIIDTDRRLITGRGISHIVTVNDDIDKAITVSENRATMQKKILAAIDAMSSNYANWGTLTAQQKDAANRNAQRFLANLGRHVLDDMSTGGD